MVYIIEYDKLTDQLLIVNISKSISHSNKQMSVF
jgi:hypothetical protein